MAFSDLPTRLAVSLFLGLPFLAPAQTTINYTNGQTVDSGLASGTSYNLAVASGTATEQSDYAGNGELHKIGNGNLILTGNITNNGGTFLEGGLLEFTTLGSGNIVFRGGALRWGPGVTDDISSRLVIVSTAILDTGDNDVTFANNIAREAGSTGGFTKTGSGTLSLTDTINQAGISGANGTYTGGNGLNGVSGTAGGSVSVTAGTLIIDNVLSATGGSGGQGGYAAGFYTGGYGGHGADGGNIVITGANATFSGDVDLTGGWGGRGGGNNGGLNSELGNSGNGGNGGHGGSVTITNGSATFSGALTLSGGGGGSTNVGYNAGIGGDGGDAGNLTFSGQSLSIFGPVLSLEGSAGFIQGYTGGQNGASGQPATFTLNGDTTYFGSTVDLGFGTLNINSGSNTFAGALSQRVLNLNGGTATFAARVSAAYGSITLAGDGATFTGEVSLTAGDTTEADGGLVIISSGHNTFAASSTLTVNGSTSLNYSPEYIFGDGGSIVIGGGTTTFAGTIISNGGDGLQAYDTAMNQAGQGGTFTVNAGSAHFTSGAAVALRGGMAFRELAYGGAGATPAGDGGNFQINGGLVTFASDTSLSLAGGVVANSNNYPDIVPVAGQPTGADGTLTLSGGTLQLAQTSWLENTATFTGNFAFTSGTLRFTDTGSNIAPGGKLATALGGGLGAGATLEFDHAVTFGADLTFNAGSTLVLHDDATVATGTAFTLNSGAILGFYLGQTVSSTLFIADGATITGPSSGPVYFDFHDLGDFAAGTYNLIDASSAGAIRDNWLASNFAVGTGIAGYTYSFAINGDVLQVTAIPEPSTYAMIFSGLVMLGVMSWLRRRR